MTSRFSTFSKAFWVLSSFSSFIFVEIFAIGIKSGWFLLADGEMGQVGDGD